MMIINVFLWCHARDLNLIDKNPQRIKKKDKELVSKLNYEGINFPLSNSCNFPEV